MVVHFPVVLLPLACFMYFLSWKHPGSWIEPAGRWALWVGTASAAVAIAAGYLAANSLGHDKPGHDLVHVHRNIMLATGSLALVVSLLTFLFWTQEHRPGRWVLGIGHLGLTALLIFGSDRGAALVYRYGFGVQQTGSSELEYSDAPIHQQVAEPKFSDGHDHSH